jgi:HSP20 family protein
LAITPITVTKIAQEPAARDALRSLRDELDRLFECFSGGFELSPRIHVFDVEPRLGAERVLPTPAVDITADDSAYHITAELPGLEEKDIEVTLTDDLLTIQGQKSADIERKEKTYYLSERRHGAFQRTFALPDGVDRDKITADVANGVLAITLPKGAMAPKKTIEVKAAA